MLTRPDRIEFILEKYNHNVIYLLVGRYFFMWNENLNINISSR